MNVNDWYEVLGVAPDASHEDIEAAFARLTGGHRSAEETEDESDERRLREYAYAVLSNPDRRQAYDAERAVARPAAASGGAPRGSSPLGLLLGGLAIVLALAAVGATAFLLLRDDDDERFTDREDADYDLEAMRLRDEDMPAGFVHTGSLEFNNEEWSPLYFTIDELQQGEALEPDLEAKHRQLDAEGRVRSFWSAYQTSDFGRTIFFFSNSTLYEDEASADESLERFCGLPVDASENVDVDLLSVPRMGDDSAGFSAPSIISAQYGIIMELEIPTIYRDTNYCFRTGRVVHALSMMSIPGAEDIALGVRLARKLEGRVEDFYNGEAAPIEQDGGEDDGG